MQGFNMGRYYPPDASNPPRFNTTHPLGSRANKSSQGILTVRFELPFAVWCNTCKPAAIIGQGVRFNAEKKKVGNYHSTPIWSFRMKHTACGAWWDIRTDPKNAEYVVFEGARRRDYGDGEKGVEEGEGGELRFLTEEEREKRRADAFAGFEGKVEEKQLVDVQRKRVEELYEGAEVWRDPYEVNARLRKDFRVKRKAWKKEDKVKEGMQDKYSLGMDIVDETEGDRARAKFVGFGGADTSADRLEDVVRKPMFEESGNQALMQVAPRGSKKLKAEIRKENCRNVLQHTLVGNSRASIDPFLSHQATEAKTTSKMKLGLLKRKRDAEPVPATNAEETTEISTTAKTMPVSHSESSEKDIPAKPALLVDYDSD
ncbi:DUF572-domain-containing protein [Massarina eburnea CBS 473.64]|uniref:DUF572-domain-containing protein n=1 Tax=Massarina eburnea CBS 473.64 TaxID=1395130 RepID=A0A6A6S261_9PLEO|nr:DUF572-domain-containing protein [Massarina eburnea CBS 473.64]